MKKYISRENIIFLLLSSITLQFLLRYTVLSKSLKWGTWSYGENLISYPDKFIRRGLLGEVVLFISNENPAFKTLNFIVFINCLLLLFLILLIFRKYEIHLRQLNVYLLSSFGLLYLIYHGNSYNRKEIFAINFFLIFILLLKNNRNEINLGLKIYLLTSLTFLALIHEGTLLIVLPFYYLILKKIDIRFSYIYSVFGLFLIGFLITQQGNLQDVEKMWNELSDFDRQQINSDLESSAIYALNYSFEKQLIGQSGLNKLNDGTLNHWLSYLFYFGIYFFVNHLGCNLKKLFEFLNSIKAFPVELVFCSLLFILGGGDWGRYFVFFIYMYYFYIIYVCDLENFKITYSAKSKHLILFLIYSFFTIMPMASFQDINLLNKINNTFQQIIDLIS